jgi:DNA-binding SARP family transcriptional activator
MVFFCVLGRVAVSVDGTEQVLGSTREAALLGDLLVHANEVVSADRLIDDLWHGEPPAGAAATLHTYVRNLRRRLEPRRASRAVSEMLLTRRPGYQLLVDRDGLDSWRAERWIREGRDALAVGDVRRARGLFTDALTLWEGPPFGELADEPFVRTEAARLEDLRLVALEERASAALALGDHFAMCGELGAVVAQHPYRERLWELWMLALYRAGRQTEALRAYQRIRGLLVDELGIEPGTALRDLDDAILLQKPDLDWYPTSESVTETSALTVPVASLSRRPDFTNAFVGREQERTGLVALIQPPAAVPVTTVTGPAGIGKTRLALHAAADVAGAYSDGAWLVELASVDAADAVADVVLTHLGGRRHAGRSALASLSEFARDRRMLVVLDNCEHVVGAAAACVDAIAGGESVTLATSREPLGLPGERVFFVPSLPDDAAVALFADRAAAVDPSFRLDEGNNVTVAEICRELDGMPLAIELAAARVRSMTVTDIADRLAARFRLLQGGPAKEHRHRTLRAAIQWSYDLLTDRQRAVFDELSAFRGGLP